MSTQHGPQSPRPIDPLVTAVAESVATGYQMLDHVIAGLRESLRLQAGSPARSTAASARPTAAFQPGRGVPPAPGGQRGSLRPTRIASPRHNAASDCLAGAANPAGVVQDLAALVAEGLGLAGTLVQDVAQAIGAQTHGSGGEECLPTLALSVPAGATGTTTFTVWNTGPTLLTDVRLSATDLIGGSLHSADNAVTFIPPSFAQIGPGKGESVQISVAVAADTRPGVYRGVVVATPGDACAVLELTVTAAPQPVAVPPVAVQPAEPEAPERETS